MSNLSPPILGEENKSLCNVNEFSSLRILRCGLGKENSKGPFVVFDLIATGSSGFSVLYQRL